MSLGVAEWLQPFGNKQEVVSLNAGGAESDDGILKHLSNNLSCVKSDMRRVNIN